MTQHDLSIALQAIETKLKDWRRSGVLSSIDAAYKDIQTAEEALYQARRRLDEREAAAKRTAT